LRSAGEAWGRRRPADRRSGDRRGRRTVRDRRGVAPDRSEHARLLEQPGGHRRRVPRGSRRARLRLVPHRRRRFDRGRLPVHPRPGEGT
jgi:hypothetical protein